MATFTNQATLSYGNNVATSNIVTGELQQALSVTKTTLDDAYTGNDVLTYVISIVNSGTTPVADITVTDDLGAYQLNGNRVVPLTYVPDSLNYYVDGVRQADPTVTGTNPLTVTGITAPASGNAFLVYQATTNEFAPPAVGGAITNTVTLTGDNIPTPVTATNTINARSEALLTITKTLSPTSVSEGDRLTYTFVIQNYGNTAVTAADNASVTDVFDPILTLTDLAVTYNGQTWVEGTDYNYAEGTGTFTTVPGRIQVPAATYVQDPTTGAFTVIPGSATLTVTGTV